MLWISIFPQKWSSPILACPGLSKVTKEESDAKRKAYNKARKTGLDADWETFRNLRRASDRSLRKSRSEYLHEVGENLTINNTKPFWSYIKSLRQSSAGVSVLNTTKGIATSALEKANALNQQFQSVFTKEDCNSLPKPGTNFTTSMPPIIIRTEGIEKLLRELKPQKAPGPDNIMPRVLKECAGSIAPLFRQIFQRSLCTGELPEDWLPANVSPIFKKGNRSDPANYRPVSLTSIPCKLLEHIMHSNMMKDFDEHMVLNDEQHGFRKDRSCETQLALTVNDLAKILDGRGKADVIIMDFSKAFDLVPHQRLLLKLQQAGVTCPLHTWISNFLTKSCPRGRFFIVSSSNFFRASGHCPRTFAIHPVLKRPPRGNHISS